MISLLCSGGLGNQMFQYAFYCNLKKQGIDVEFDTSYFDYNSVHSGYELQKCFGINEGTNRHNRFSKKWGLVYSLMAKMRMKRLFNIKFEGYPINKIFKMKTGILYGYWQSEKYFQGIEEYIKKRFTFKNISEESKLLLDSLHKENSVAIHVRRGDYLKLGRYVNLSETEYYRNAIKKIYEEVSCPAFFVFSDDINWCRENMSLPNDTIYVDFNCSEKSYEDMFLMSNASNIILANSSFSWWAGYLGNHNRVYRPSKYKVDWKAEDDIDLFPVRWIKVEV